MHIQTPRYAQVVLAIAVLLVLLASPVFGIDGAEDTSEAKATVERMVAGMIADTMKRGYRQPPVSIVLVACTYGETGKRSEYSTWLEATIKEVLRSRVGICGTRGIAIQGLQIFRIE